MELFHEYKNKCINALIILAERIANGEKMSYYQFEGEYYRLADDLNRTSAIFYKNVVNDMKCPIFNIHSKENVCLCEKTENKISISDIPLNTEKLWIQSALNDNFSKLFYNEEQISQLKQMNTDIPNYYKCIDDNWRGELNYDNQDLSNFSILLDAINNRRKITYSVQKKICEGEVVKIEYDERKGCLYAIIISDNRPLKVDISKMSEIHIFDEIIGDISDVRENMKDKKAKTPVIFKVTDRHNHNALERAILAFSVYDHEVEKLNEKEARFTIRYYRMDFDIIIKEILSFGPDIQVENPSFVKKRIIDILRKYDSIGVE